MSKDELFLTATTEASQNPEPGFPGSLPHDVDGMTLRSQVLELINDVLTDTAPEGERARRQLRDLLAANPDEPEWALLQHLVTVTTMNPANSTAA
jgi:hypothetical protein